jgi:hypothetical protein
VKKVTESTQTVGEVYGLLKQDDILNHKPDHELRQMAEQKVNPPAEMPKPVTPSRPLEEILESIATSAPDEAPEPDEAAPLYSGTFEQRSVDICEAKGWTAYKPDNFPARRLGLDSFRTQLTKWIFDKNKRTLFVLITGLEGRGKTFLAHLIAVITVLAFSKNRIPWRALFVRDSELRQKIDSMQGSPDETPLARWVRLLPKILIVDEFGKNVVSYGRADKWNTDWREIFTQLKDQEKARLVIVVSNIGIEDLHDWERKLPGSDGSAPVARRLTTKDDIQLNLAGKDWSK